MSNIREDEMIDLAYKVQVLLLSGEDMARNGYDLANELVANWIAEHKIQVLWKQPTRQTPRLPPQNGTITQTNI